MNCCPASHFANRAGSQFAMGPVRMRHRSHHFATKPSHSVDRAGWHARKPKWLPLNFGYYDVMRTSPIQGAHSIKFRISWRNAHGPIAKQVLFWLEGTFPESLTFSVLIHWDALPSEYWEDHLVRGCFLLCWNQTWRGFFACFFFFFQVTASNRGTNTEGTAICSERKTLRIRMHVSFARITVLSLLISSPGKKTHF